jgi:hypothetical protein
LGKGGGKVGRLSCEKDVAGKSSGMRSRRRWAG